MKIKTFHRAGFTLLEIMTVVAIIGFLAAIVIPNLINSRSTSQMNTCINNLRQIDSAKQQWVLEKGKQNTDTPADTDLCVYVGRAGAVATFDASVICPIDPGKSFATSYTINACNVAPACQIMPADATYPHKLSN